MFNLICVFILALVGAIGFFSQSDPEGPLHIAGIVFFCISGVWFFGSFVNGLYYYDQQIKRFEDIRGYLKKIVLYQEKQKNLIDEFKVYLAEKYPELEKEVFKMISSSSSDIHVMLSYPEIKSSETLMELVSQINKQASEVYNRREYVENLCVEVRHYSKNNWFIIKPSVPSDIQKLL